MPIMSSGSASPQPQLDSAASASLDFRTLANMPEADDAESLSRR